MELFGTVNRTLDKRLFVAAAENALFWALAGLAFTIPLALDGPQLLVGATVNAFLIVCALGLGARHSYALALLPSLGALSRGMLFGPFTPALAVMLPFIWLGNLALIYAMKKLFVEQKINYAASLFAAASVKAALLFGFAFALLQANLVPALFLTAMGIVQFATALMGGAAAYAVLKFNDKQIRHTR